MAIASHPSADDPVLVSEAARLLNKSVATVRKWEARGRLRASRTPGGVRVFSRADVERLDDAVLDAIEEHVLTPEAVEQVVLLSERDDHAEKQVILDREHKSNAKKIARLVEVIAEGGGTVSALVEKLRALEARQREIETERTTMQPLPRLPKKVVDDRLAEWRRLLRSSNTQARAVLQRVIVGRIVFTPTAEDRPVKNGIAAPGYRFEHRRASISCLPALPV